MYSEYLEYTKHNFIFHKLFIPWDYYVILNLKTEKEKNL
jgi:hypothetical protein